MSLRVLKILVSGLLLSFGLTGLPAAALWQSHPQIGNEGLLEGHSRDVYNVAISPDGQYLASSSFDGMTQVWNTQSWERVHHLAGHTNWAGTLAFSPDNRWLATGGMMDGLIQIWDLTTGQSIQTLTVSKGGVLSLAFSPDGQQLAVGRNNQVLDIYRTLDWQKERQISDFLGGVASVAFSPDGKYLASASFNEPRIALWDPISGERLHSLNDHDEELYALAFSPDGKYLASAGADRIIRLWQVDTLLPVARLSGHLRPVWALRFSPDSQLLASGSMGDHTLRLWSVPQGVNLQTLAKASEKTYALAFSPDGQTLFSSHGDGKVRVWSQSSAAQAADAERRERLDLSLKIDRWRGPEPGASPALGELALKIEHYGRQHLDGVNAEVRILTPGVLLKSPVNTYFIARFEAGTSKRLSLPLELSKGFKAEAIELEIQLFSGEGSARREIRLPLRVPLNTPAPEQKAGS